MPHPLVSSLAPACTSVRAASSNLADPRPAIESVCVPAVHVGILVADRIRYAEIREYEFPPQSQRHPAKSLPLCAKPRKFHAVFSRQVFVATPDTLPYQARGHRHGDGPALVHQRIVRASFVPAFKSSHLVAPSAQAGIGCSQVNLFKGNRCKQQARLPSNSLHNLAFSHKALLNQNPK